MIYYLTIGNCNYISSKTIYLSRGKQKSNYYYIPFPQFDEFIYNKWINIKKANRLILGPNFLPNSWESFLNGDIWQERRFLEVLNDVKGITIHSRRVINHLINRTNINNSNLFKKFKIIRPCTNIKPKNINSFTKRKIDILLFEKYQDLDHSQQGMQLLNLLNNTSKKIERLKFGNYTKESIKYLANNTKFIIYFSFFDTGAIGLKEFQNYGVFTFSHQRELIINKNTGFYAPELANEKDMTQVFQIIMKKIEVLINNF